MENLFGLKGPDTRRRVYAADMAGLEIGPLPCIERHERDEPGIDLAIAELIEGSADNQFGPTPKFTAIASTTNS